MDYLNVAHSLALIFITFPMIELHNPQQVLNQNNRQNI